MPWDTTRLIVLTLITVGGLLALWLLVKARSLDTRPKRRDWIYSDARGWHLKWSQPTPPPPPWARTATPDPMTPAPPRPEATESKPPWSGTKASMVQRASDGKYIRLSHAALAEHIYALRVSSIAILTEAEALLEADRAWELAGTFADIAHANTTSSLEERDTPILRTARALSNIGLDPKHVPQPVHLGPAPCSDPACCVCHPLGSGPLANPDDQTR